MLRLGLVAVWLMSLLGATQPPGPPGIDPVNPGPNGYFEATLPPGGSEGFQMVVENLGSTVATYRIYAADATTAEVTGVSYSELGAPLSAAGSWLSIPTSTVTLAPGAHQTVAFTVTVPTGVSPGDHVAAVAAETPGSATSTQKSSNGSGASVALTTTARVVVAVVVHVPGPARMALSVGRPQFQIQNGGRQILAIPLDDTGDLLIKPLLVGSVTPCRASQPVVRIDRQLDTFVPHTAIVYPYSIEPAPLARGCYTVDLATSVDGQTLGAFQGDVSLGPVAAGTATTLNGGGLGQAGLARHSSPSSSALLEIIIGVLAAVVVALLVLLLRRRHPPRPAAG